MEKIGWIIILLLSVSACKKLDTCLEPHGKATEEFRPINNGFHTIEIHDFIDLYIHPGQIQEHVKVTGGANLLSSVKTEVKDSTLFIRQELACKWSRNYDQRYAVHVRLPSFKRLKYYGSGDVFTTDTISGDTIIIDSWNGTGSFKFTLKANKIILGINSGNVDMKVKGEVNRLYIWQQGLGVIDVEGMKSPYGWVDHGATGHCFLGSGFQYLDIMQYGVGHIYYSGNPTLNFIRNDGPGKVIKK